MITVFIPVYNEEKSIEKIVQEVCKLNFDKEVLIVDDGSTDNSFSILKKLQQEYPIRIIKHKKNIGKGAGIRTAVKYTHGDYFVIQDADFEYEPDDLYKVVRLIQHTQHLTLETQHLKLWALGYRDLSLKPDFRFFHNFVNHLLTILINILYGGIVKDSYSGCKLLPTEFMRKVNLKSTRFEIESELTIKLLKKGYKIKQTQIKYNPRRTDEGKKIGILDAVKGILMIISLKFSQ